MNPFLNPWLAAWAEWQHYWWSLFWPYFDSKPGRNQQEIIVEEIATEA